MATLMFKRMFRFGGQDYLYKVEQIAPDQIQKAFGKVAESDRNNNLDFLPKTGITHKIGYDYHTNKPDSFEKMSRDINEIGLINLTETDSVHASKGKFPYWVTLKGNKFETAYVQAEDAKKINSSDIKTTENARVYENHIVGYDRIYSNKDGDVLEYSYFPNLFDPRLENTKPVQDTLTENTIISKASRLINRLKNLQNKG